MSLARKIKRNSLKQYTKEKEKEMQEKNPNNKIKSLPFNKYWEQYQKSKKAEK